MTRQLGGGVISQAANSAACRFDSSSGQELRVTLGQLVDCRSETGHDILPCMDGEHGVGRCRRHIDDDWAQLIYNLLRWRGVIR